MKNGLGSLIVFHGVDEMLPDGKLSSQPVAGRMVYDIGVPTTKTLDYKMGGINIQDPSKGLDYQVWRGQILNPASDNSSIVIDGRFSPEHHILTYPFMIEFNFSFDFNMNPMAVFIAREVREINGKNVTEYNTYLYWYDTTIPGFTILPFGSSFRTPKLIIDDPRQAESQYYSLSDVCMFYWRSGNLCVRYLRDRFTVETILKRNVPYIEKVGMNEHFRLQWDLLREVDICNEKDKTNNNTCSRK